MKLQKLPASEFRFEDWYGACYWRMPKSMAACKIERTKKGASKCKK